MNPQEHHFAQQQQPIHQPPLPQQQQQWQQQQFQQPPSSNQQPLPPPGAVNGNYQQNVVTNMAGMNLGPPPQQQHQQQQVGKPIIATPNANFPPQAGFPGQQNPTSAQNGSKLPPTSIYPPQALNNNSQQQRPPSQSSLQQNGPHFQQQQQQGPPPPSSTPQQQFAHTQYPPITSAGNQGVAQGPPRQPPLPQQSGQLISQQPGQQTAQQPGQPPQPPLQNRATQQFGAPPSAFQPANHQPPPATAHVPPTSQQQLGVPATPALSTTSGQPPLPPLVGVQQQQKQPLYPTAPGLSGLPHMPPPQPQKPNQYAGGQSLHPLQQAGGGMPPLPTGYLSHQGMPPQSAMPSLPGQTGIQPGGYPQQPGFPPQQPGFPSQPQGFPPQQPGFQPQQQPGFPPQAGRGYNQPPGVYGSVPGGYSQAAAPQRRLDPDQMPNPIQVMYENQRACGGPFITNQPGLVPPLVTTKYLTQDQGNSSPRFIRSSLYSVPATVDILKQTAIPFTLIISPFARSVEGELQPPIVDFGELGPIRCIRCKAYMSPNMQFIDGGRRFSCPLCKVTTEVPTEYFQHLDHTGQRIDKYERPELVLGSYEFVATKDYCRNNIPPGIPAYIFVIDVSYNNVKSGLVHLLCREIRNIIQNFPADQGHEKSKMRVGFITFNSVVHFYNIKSTLAQPQMMVVGDVQDMFMPLLDGFLCNPEESDAVIASLMEQIPQMFGDTKETETVLLPAIQAGLEALKASNSSGKLLVFNSSLPIADAPGKLKNRDDRKLLGTEKEKAILTPQCTSYNNLGQECVLAGVSVDLFIFNNSYVDIATVGQVSRLTGGEIYKYTYFQADIDGNRLVEDLIKNVSRPIAFDTVMRVRTSTGIRPTDFFGHFFMSNTTDMEVAAIDCDKSVAIEIKHDDKLPTEENVYVQVALLYTSVSGQRRLRVLNLVLRTTSEMSDVFKSCDLNAAILFMAKQSMFKLMEHSPKAVKDNLIHRSAQLLACYRKNCTSPTSAGQLILPECMKLLPLYVSCLMKNDALSGGSDMTCDDRSYVIHFVLAMDLPISVSFFYPRLIPIHDVDVSDSDIPPPIRCTYDKLQEDGAYILENGIHLFIWLGLGLSAEFLQPVFGVQMTQQVDTNKIALPVLDTPLSKRIRDIVQKIQDERTRSMRVTLICQRDKLETVLRHFLVEDRGTSDGSPSYVDFLCHMHKEIKELLS